MSTSTEAQDDIHSRLARADRDNAMLSGRLHTMEIAVADMGAENEKLKRELAEERWRLDWLDGHAAAFGRTLAVVQRGKDTDPIRWAGIEWDGRETMIRAAIDEACGLIATP